MPPVSKKLLAKVARAVKSAGVPRLARNTFGRAPVLFSNRIGVVAQRFERRGQPHRRQRVELDFGFAIGRERDRLRIQHRDRRPHAGWEIRWRRSAPRLPLGDIGLARSARRRDLALDQVLFERGEQRRRPFRSPETAPMPLRKAAASASRCRRSRRRDRTTLARLDSSSSTSCVLRATRRANASGKPSASVCGSTVMALAPPRPAENVAMVARSMFT